MSTTSVHLLFLLSLGVFSWAILCYFKDIEKRLMCSTNNYQVPPIDAAEEAGRQELGHDNRPFQCRDNYNLYVNFVCILACIYALAKVAHIAERYLTRQMYGKLYIQNQNELCCLPMRGSLKDCVESSEDLLRLQIDALKMQNHALEIELNKSINENSQASAKEASPPSDGVMHNIFISKSHVHLDQQVYVNSKTFVAEIHSYPEEPEKMNDVWQNYLEMQKGPFTNKHSMWASIKRESYAPVVLSTEDLQKFHGLI